MTNMNDKAKEQMLNTNPHLKKYIDNIKRKMKEPVFYSTLPYEVREEKYPNLIYPGKGSIFYHFFSMTILFLYKFPNITAMEFTSGHTLLIPPFLAL